MARGTRKGMTEDELKTLVDGYVVQSVGYIGGTLSEQRRKAMEYYQQELFGNEQDGRSQFVTSDVQDTIEWMLPSLIEIFVANDKAVVFSPTGEEDVEAAEQATDYVNHVLNTDGNNSFTLFYQWFKDALLSKNGIAKAWAEEINTVNEEYYEGLTQIQVVELYNDDDNELLGATQRIDPETGQPVWDVNVRVTKAKRQIRTAGVPPEEFLISRRATSIEDAVFCGHRQRKTQSDLILMGYDRKTIENLPSHDAGGEYNDERVTRYSRDEEFAYTHDGGGLDDPASREIWINEVYVRCDFDGDGIAELRRVVSAGSGDNGTLLENELCPYSRPPFYSLCPVPITHKFFGLSIADLTMDIQRIRSELMRQMLDAQFLANNPRHAVVENETTIEDMLVSRPGGIVRVTRPEAMPQPIQTLPPSQTTYNLLEFITGERESRTGVTKYGQGLDSGTLNDTASGINQLMTAAQMRIKLIARIFAETGVRELMLGVHELVCKYQDTSRTIQLRNTWIDVDPREWSDRQNMTIEVGLGAGNKEMQLLHMDGMAETQAAIVQVQGGVEGPIVHAKHIYALANKRAELAGFKQADIFFGDPEDEANKPPEKPQAPDPEQIKAQAEMQKEQMRVQADIEKTKAQLDQKAQEAAAKAQEAQAKVSLEAEEAAAKLELERGKLAQERQEHEDKMALEYEKLNAEREANSLDVISRHVEKSNAERDKLTRESELLNQKNGYERDAADRAAREAEYEARSRVKSVSVQRDAGGRITGATVTEEGQPASNVSVNRGADGKIAGATVKNE